MPRVRRINIHHTIQQPKLHPVVIGLLAFNTTSSIFFYIYANSNNQVLKSFCDLHSSTHGAIGSIHEVLKKVIELK
jgi:hypothetical protein